MDAAPAVPATGPATLTHATPAVPAASAAPTALTAMATAAGTRNPVPRVVAAAAAAAAHGEVDADKPGDSKRKRRTVTAAPNNSEKTLKKLKQDVGGRVGAEVVLVIDRSGSMQSYGSEGVAAVQAAIDEVPSARGADARLTLRTFDNAHAVCAQSVLAKGYKINPVDMAPRGTTALYDAVAHAIEHANTMILDKEVFVIVFTDGHDNSSSHTASQVAGLIATARAKGVDFTWLAAGISQMSTAISMGIDPKDVMEVGSAGAHMRSAMRSSSYKSASGFSANQRAQASPCIRRPTA